MIRRSVPRRGLSLLIGLTGLLAYLIYRSVNPYCIGVEAVVVPLLIAELLRQGNRIGRIVLWLVTMPLPTRARTEWREDFASALAEREDGRGPIDVSLDIALGMPIILWREWAAALPSMLLFDDELPFSWRRALRMAALWAGILVVCDGLDQWHFAALEWPGLIAMSAPSWMLGAARPSRIADRRRLVLTFSYLLAGVIVVIHLCSWQSLTAAIALTAIGGLIAIRPTTRRTALATTMFVATMLVILALPAIGLALLRTAGGTPFAICVLAAAGVVYLEWTMVITSGVILSLPESVILGTTLGGLSVLAPPMVTWSSSLLAGACLCAAGAGAMMALLLQRARGLIEIWVPRSTGDLLADGKRLEQAEDYDASLLIYQRISHGDEADYAAEAFFRIGMITHERDPETAASAWQAAMRSSKAGVAQPAALNLALLYAGDPAAVSQLCRPIANDPDSLYRVEAAMRMAKAAEDCDPEAARWAWQIVQKADDAELAGLATDRLAALELRERQLPAQPLLRWITG